MQFTNDRRCGLRWKFTSVLEYLDYADDIALISSRFADLQEKTDRLVVTAGIVVLKIHPCKTNTLWDEPQICGLHQDRRRGGGIVESFVYLGSVLDKLSSTEKNIKRRLALARTAFTRLLKVRQI